MVDIVDGQKWKYNSGGLDVKDDYEFKVVDGSGWFWVFYEKLMNFD